ncbi:MAG: hypothetical protein ACOC8N_01985 [Spirochaetota bacterium]
MQLELVQPVDGLSIYADWLEEHGEGLHHFNFLVDSHEELQRAARELTGALNCRRVKQNLAPRCFMYCRTMA